MGQKKKKRKDALSTKSATSLVVVWTRSEFFSLVTAPTITCDVHLRGCDCPKAWKCREDVEMLGDAVLFALAENRVCLAVKGETMREAEIKLRDELYCGAPERIKTRCASCALRGNPNGSIALVGSAQQLSRYQEIFRDATTLARKHDTADRLLLFDDGDLARLFSGDDSLLRERGLEDRPKAPVLRYHLKLFFGRRPLFSKEELLVLARDSPSRWIFDLPGGKRHLGETSWDAALRETREETLLDFRHLPVLEHFDDEEENDNDSRGGQGEKNKGATMRCFVLSAEGGSCTSSSLP